MRTRLTLLLAVLLLAAPPVFAGAPMTAVGELPPPPAAREDGTVDDYHGTPVADPYRWLENPDDDEVRAWVDAQNARTEHYFLGVSALASFRDRLTAVWDYERMGIPKREAAADGGEVYFFTRNTGLQNQSPTYRRAVAPGSPEQLVIDPNTLSADGTVSVGGTAVSRDGRWFAYMISRSGSDWNECKVIDLKTGAETTDHLHWLKFTGPAWDHSGAGFYYGRFPEPEGSGTAHLRAENRNYRLHYHKLGTPQSEDPLIYERPDDDRLGFGPGVTDDGAFLLVSVWRGSDNKAGLSYAELKGDALPTASDIKELLPQGESMFDFIGNAGRTFFVLTNHDAPRRRLVAIDLDAPGREHWRTLIPEGADTLKSVLFMRDVFVATWMRDAYSVVTRHDIAGTPIGEVALPGLGAVRGFGGRHTDRETFFSYTSFLEPGSIHRLDPVTGATERFWAPSIDFDPSPYETRQVFATAPDGGRVPIFLTHRRGLALNGANPTLLYGYGGFNVSMTPSFSASLIPWIEGGGVYALAVLRGGGEYGEEWHTSGMLEKKQAVFDDFYTAAEWLVTNKYTSPANLAAEGGSNGGLLVGAAITQRPELWGAALPKMGVLDMLRYHRFTIGWGWVPEYGSAEVAEQFPFLLKYSPLHNTRAGAHYPPTLIATADHDDRVVPAHSYKFAAALQKAQGGESPVLLRVETRTGHGAGKPMSKLIEDRAQELAFLAHELGMTVPGAAGE